MDEELKNVLDDINISLKKGMEAKHAIDHSLLELLRISNQLSCLLVDDKNVDIQKLYDDLYSAHFFIRDTDYGDTAGEAVEDLLEYSERAKDKMYVIAKRNK